MGVERSENDLWKSGAGPSKETLAAYLPLTREERWTLVNSVTGRHIVTMFLCAGIAYLGLSLGQLGHGLDQTHLALCTLYGLTGVSMLAFSWRARVQPPPVMWSVHIAGLLFVTITATITAGYALSKDPSAFYFYVLTQFAAGAVVHSRLWLVAIMVFGDLAWGVTSLSVEGVNWVRCLGYLPGFSAVALGLNYVRARTRVRMEELRRAAERASAAKTELLADVSHEVRTPMNGVLGLSGLLLDSDLDAKQRKMVIAIRESAEALMSIVDEVLDFSQLRKGQMDLESAAFDLGALLDGVDALMQPRASAKGLSLEVVTKGFEGSRFIGDAGRIRQVLLNLVSNAIKFTDSGSVRVVAEPLKGELRGVRLTVQDTGSGIPQEMLGRVFTRYHRNREDGVKGAGGTGLGLAISKDLVELMGGEIRVESQVGRGTCFWAEIPLAPGPDETLRVLDTDGTGDFFIRGGARVLLAEDNPTSRMVTEALLKKLSCDVDVAIDGREALEKARGGDYDIVFMDCYMPLMDGFQATRRIRQRRPNEELPVIALTASVTDEDRARCVEAGMNDTIHKPVRMSLLAKAIERWVPVGGSRSARAVSSLPPPSTLDLNMVRGLVSLDGEDDDFIREVMGGYVDQLKDVVAKLATAVAANDTEEARLLAHSMKGASKQIGATRAGTLLGAIEEQGDIATIETLIEQLDEEVPRVESAIRALLRRSRRAS